MRTGRVQHFFTVDVEEHFQVSALAPVVPRSSWGQHESRVVRNTDLVLELLDRHGAKGTFFILGWVAQRQPELVRRIAAGGHEVASHGWGHRKVTDITPAQFRRSVASSKEVLEDLSGTPVLGYRAPSFSIVRGREWALDVLVEEGYVYDSSLFPIRRRGYGYAGAPRDRHELPRQGGVLHEFPPATLQLLGARLPAAGGAYLRLLPLSLITNALKQAEARGVAGTFYIHPWEVDPAQPRVPVDALTRVRHYGGLGRTVTRLEKLLTDFRFGAIAHELARDTVVRPAAPDPVRLQHAGA